MINKSGVPIKNQPKKKSRPSLLGRLLLWLFILASIFVGLGLLSRIKNMQIQIGTYENIIVTDTETISVSLEQYLDQRFLYPKSNRLWFRERKVEEYIEKQFPRIANVQVSSKAGSFSVYGEEREGFYLWCGREVVPVSTDSECYFADSTGFIFDIAPYFSGTSYLRLYGGNVSEQIVGSQAFSPELFDLYKKFQSTLESFDLSIQAMNLLPEDQLEFLLDSNNPTPDAPRLKYYLLNDSDVVVNNISFALKQDLVLLDITNNYDRLEYLDVRFKNQLVYKFFDTESSGEIINYEEPIPQTNPETSEPAPVQTGSEG